MNLGSAHSVATELMAQHRLLDQGWDFRFDNALTRGGLCDFRRKVISVSRELVWRHDETFLINTVLHEIAHALVGFRHGHDSEWKRVARSIGGTSDTCHMAVPLWRYVGTCARCGVRVYAMRRTTCSCTKCSPGRFDRNARFMWKRADLKSRREMHSAPVASPVQLRLDLDDLCRSGGSVA